VLYNGLYSFRRRLEDLRNLPRRGSAPQLQLNSHQPPVSPATSAPTLSQHARSMLRANPQSNSRLLPSQGTGALSSTPNMRPYPHLGAATRTLSLPDSTASTSLASNMYYTPVHLPGTAIAQPPQNISQATVVTWSQPVAQRTPTYQPPSGPLTNPKTVPASVPISEVTDPALSAPPPDMVASSEEQDLPWDLDWDELEALDRSEWEAKTASYDNQTETDNRSTPSERDESTLVDAIVVDSVPATAPTIIGLSLGASLVEEPSAIEELQGNVPATQPPATSPVIPKVEAEYSAPQLLRTPPLAEGLVKGLQALERRRSLMAADVIDIDELSDDEPVAQPSSLSSRAVSSTPAEDVINIQDSDEEMEVDELEPSEPPESIEQSAQVEEDQSGESFGQDALSNAENLQSSATPTQQSAASAQQGSTFFHEVDAYTYLLFCI
jgi:hypothetical protein